MVLIAPSAQVFSFCVPVESRAPVACTVQSFSVIGASFENWFWVTHIGSGVDGKGPLFNVTKRGKVTYYMEGDGVISSLVTKDEPDGDLLIHFAGLTGGTSKSGYWVHSSGGSAAATILSH